MAGETAQHVEIEIDGQKLEAEAGICVAAALLRCGIKYLRQSPAGNPRGAFCMMGVCQECLINSDGRTVQACLTPVRAGMRVETGGWL